MFLLGFVRGNAQLGDLVAIGKARGGQFQVPGGPIGVSSPPWSGKDCERHH